MPGRISLRWSYALIVLVALAAHGLNLNAGFYMDDWELILKKEAVKSGHWFAGEFAWRWIPYLIFCFTYRLFGASPTAFHVTNLAVHITLACVLFAAARDIFTRLKVFGDDAVRRRAAFFGALIFACHPLCTEPVNYARCVMIEMVTLFSVIATWMAVRFFDDARGVTPIFVDGRMLGPGRQPVLRWGIWLAASVGLAACSKNPGLFHALGNVALVCVVMGGLGKLAPALKWKLSGRRWLFALPLFVIVFVLSYNWSSEVRGAILRWQDVYLVHTLTQGRIFWEYVERIFFPLYLCSDHYIAWSGGFADLEAVVKTAGFVLLSAAGFAGLFATRFRAVALLLCLALAPFQLRLLYPVKELMVEYRAYPAMPWVGLLAGMGIALIHEKRSLAGTALMAALVGTCAARSAARAMVWSSPIALAENVRAQYPLNGRAVTHLQGAAFGAGDFARVVALKRDMEELTRLNEQFNRDHRGYRAYEYVRAQENYCNSEQLVVYALAHWQGAEVAVSYADARLAELGRKMPRFYLSAKTGGYHPENNLVKARQFVKSRMAPPGKG